MQSFVGRTSVLTPITFLVPGPDPASHVIIAHQENRAIFWSHTQEMVLRDVHPLPPTNGTHNTLLCGYQATFSSDPHTHMRKTAVFAPSAFFFLLVKEIFFWGLFPMSEGNSNFTDNATPPHIGELAREGSWHGRKLRGENRKDAGRRQTEFWQLHIRPWIQPGLFCNMFSFILLKLIWGLPIVCVWNTPEGYNIRMSLSIWTLNAKAHIPPPLTLASLQR